MKSAKIMIKNNEHIVIKINKYLERYVFLRIFVSKKKKKNNNCLFIDNEKYYIHTV